MQTSARTGEVGTSEKTMTPKDAARAHAPHATVSSPHAERSRVTAIAATVLNIRSPSCLGPVPALMFAVLWTGRGAFTRLGLRPTVAQSINWTVWRIARFRPSAFDRSSARVRTQRGKSGRLVAVAARSAMR